MNSAFIAGRYASTVAATTSAAAAHERHPVSGAAGGEEGRGAERMRGPQAQGQHRPRSTRGARKRGGWVADACPPAPILFVLLIVSARRDHEYDHEHEATGDLRRERPQPLLMQAGNLRYFGSI